MLWLIVWGVLIVGTLIGALLLGLRLYRQVRRFLRQLNETTVVLERLTERIDELERLREEPAFVPGLAATAARRARWRRQIAESHARRDTSRRERRRATLARWRLERVLGTAERRFTLHQIPSTQGGE